MDVEEVVMVGRVAKVRMYDPFRLFRQLPDWRALNLWYRKLRHDKRNDAVLGALADELAPAGLNLIDTTRYIPEHMADAGVMMNVSTGRQDPAGHPICASLPSQNGLRSSRFRTLPGPDLGSGSSWKEIDFGTL